MTWPWHAVGDVPSGVADALAAAGAVRTADAGPGVLVAPDLDRGLAALRAVPAALRARVVVVSPDADPADTRVQAAGGLAWAPIAPPAWLLDAVRRAHDRRLDGRALGPIDALVELDDLQEASRGDYLHGVAAVVAEALDASAHVAERDPRTGEFGVVLRDGHGTVPRALLDEAARRPDPVSIPSLAHHPTLAPTADADGALAVQLARADLGDADTVLVLTWPTPFVPTAAELRLARLVGTLTRATLARLAERARLVAAHNRHMLALSHVVPPVRTDGAPPGLERFVREVLLHHVPHPALRALYVRVSAHSRGAPRWLGWRPDTGGTTATDARPAALGAVPLDVAGGPHPLPGGGHAVVVPLDHGLTGHLVGCADTPAGARALTVGLTDLGRDLGLGALLARWSSDTSALMALSRDQGQLLDSEATLTRMLDQVRQGLAADGARLHVVQRGPEGHRLRVLAQSAPDGPRAPADDLERALGHDGASQVDRGHPTLLAPLHGPRESSALLEIWRTTPEPFDDALDVDALGRFAPHVAAAARRVLLDETLASRLDRMSALLDRLDPEASLHDAARHAATEVGELAGAAVAALLRRAPRGGPLYVEALWAWDDALAATLAAALASAARALSPGAAPWTDEVIDGVRVELAAWGLDRELVPRRCLASTAPEGKQPTSAILLLDHAPGARLPRPFAPDVQDDAASEFFRYATALLENTTRASARVCADRLGRAELSATAIGHLAAEQLLATTGVDAALVAVGGPGHAVVQTVLPERASLVGRVVSPGAVDAALQRDLAAAFGWPRAASWASAPMVYRGRVLGGLVIASGEDGPSIGWHRQQVLDAVAERAALELDKAQRRALLEDLNAIAERLAGLVGDELGQRLHSEARAWVRAHLRADGRVAVVSRVGMEQPLVLCGEPELDAARLRELHLASHRWGPRRRAWTPADAPDELPGTHGLAVPLWLPDPSRLAGHLVVLSEAPFDDHDLDAAADAARELAVVLDSERVRHGLMSQTGLFRHALLSPVQGLTDAALFLAELSTHADADAELVSTQRARVYREAETIRRWRRIQALYGGGVLGTEITLRKRRQDLRPLIAACVDRFTRLVAERRIALRTDLSGLQHPTLDVDADAFDLVLSNLLDNAAKYAFYNRHIVVGAHEDRQHAHVWVEDVGHPVPDDLDVYVRGKRLTWSDPFRTIHGEGMGLAIALSLAREHGGDLTHTSRPEHEHVAEGREATRPYKVRFTLSLPRATR